MAVTTAALIAGAAASAYGAYTSNRNARRAQDAQNRALGQSTTTSLDPFSVLGLGGTGASWGPQYSVNPGTGGISSNMTPEVANALRGFGIPGLGLGGNVGLSGNATNHMVTPPVFTAGSGVRLQGGNLDPISAALSQYAGAGVPSFSNQLPANVQQALNSFQGVQGIPSLDMNGLDRILGGANQAFTQAQQGLSQAGQIGGFNPAALFSGAQGIAGQIPGSNQFQTGLQDTAFGNAQSLLGNLGQTYDQAYGNTLETLRAQAQPQEARAFAGLTDNLFATGRLGSSGGALQTEAFARGLGQADLSRQLAAGQEGRLAQQNQLGLATGQAGLGMGLANQGNANMGALSNAMSGLFGAGFQGTGLQDQLLNSAYGRFGQTSQMAADLNQARFARSMYGNELAYNRGQNMLGTQINLAGLPAALQSAQLGNVNSALQGQSGIQSQLLQLFGAGLSAEQAAANARVGAGSNMAQIVGSPSFGAGGQANAAMWSQLGSSLLNPNGLGGVMGRIFGGGETIQSPDAWGALNDALRTGQVGG